MAPTPIAARVPAHRVCHPAEALPILVVTKNQAHDHRVLICDRDAKWSAPVRERLGEAGIRVVQTPFQAPNANAYAERFVRSIKHECLNRVIPFGERHLRRTIAEYVEHYHRERNHQGLENELIEGAPAVEPVGRIRRRQRLGGLLNYYVAPRDETRGSIRRLGSTMGHYGNPPGGGKVLAVSRNVPVTVETRRFVATRMRRDRVSALPRKV